MPDDFLSDDDYKEVLLVLAQKLVGLLQDAKQRGLVPPFELHVTGSDDDVIVHCLYKGDSSFVSLVPGSLGVHARWPVTAIVTDANGEAIELQITPSSQVQ